MRINQLLAAETLTNSNKFFIHKVTNNGSLFSAIPYQLNRPSSLVFESLIVSICINFRNESGSIELVGSNFYPPRW